MNDAMANAVVQAADSAGVELGNQSGQLLVVGGGCNTSGIGNVKDGKQYSTLSAPRPIYDSEKSVELIADYFSGKTVPELSVTTPLEIITTKNIGQYADACSY
jgi:ABC-type sugar transport system substrate-binding protein